MKATIERAVLLKSLSHVQSVVERRNTIPILSHVLLNASLSHPGYFKASTIMSLESLLRVMETEAGLDHPIVRAVIIFVPFGAVYLGVTLALGVTEARALFARLKFNRRLGE